MCWLLLKQAGSTCSESAASRPNTCRFLPSLLPLPAGGSWIPSHTSSDTMAVSSCRTHGDSELCTICCVHVCTTYRNITYEIRLKESGLTTLETRRLRQDQIEVFKILNGYENIVRNIFFSVKEQRTRGY